MRQTHINKLHSTQRGKNETFIGVRLNDIDIVTVLLCKVSTVCRQACYKTTTLLLHWLWWLGACHAKSAASAASMLFIRVWHARC